MKFEEIVVPKLNYEDIINEICSFIKSVVEKAKASGVVVGLSGGIDSSLTAALCANSLGDTRVLGVLMPTDFTPKADVEDAKKLAEQLKIRTEFINIQGISEEFFKCLGLNNKDLRDKKLRGNIYARVRMTALYYLASLNNYLVVGTSDRSEALIGFFTKYGDGGSDLLPIIHLYKMQVRELAKYMGISEEIYQKPSSPQLYPGHKATDEIPVDYDVLDSILVGLFDLKLPLKEVSRLTCVPLKIVEEVIYRFNSSSHKRLFPPMVQASLAFKKHEVS